MASLEPIFRRGADGSLLLTDTVEVKVIKDQHRKQDFVKTKPPSVVREKAMQIVRNAGGDINNSKHLLGCFEIQFGQFRGQTFKWMLENSPGYAGYIVAGMDKDETAPTDFRWIHKMALKKYVELWPEGREIVERKRKSFAVKTQGVSQTSQAAKGDMSDVELLLATQEIEQITTTAAI